MTKTNVSKVTGKDWDIPDPRVWFKPRIATVVLISIILICGAIVAAWFSGAGQIEQIFWQLQWLQDNPPMWLEAPMVTGRLLAVPTIILLIISLAITKISPEPIKWSRLAMVTILLILNARYLLWRSLSTLNVATPLNGVFSIGLFALELFSISNGALELFLITQARDRSEEADRYAEDVAAGAYYPTVDVFIPTYNEPAFILRRTIIGCQAINYDRKKIYVLDDTRRPEIRALATELGCEYICRPDNEHAKAGNLNHAIGQTNGELIVCFDADFVPTRNFLQRTVGFFQKQNLALLQTPQSYYNADPVARNLGLENIIAPEHEVFHRKIQPARDGTGSVVCSGTSFVIRRSALANAGGKFVTSSLSEDYFTSIRLAGCGYDLAYLDEKLSAGAAPDDMASMATQRLRWAQGTLQAFFIEENPFMIRGLSLRQRFGHLGSVTHWFTSFARVAFLLIPLAYSFLGIIPVKANLEEIIYYFLPVYCVNLATFSWFSYRARSVAIAEIYDIILCIPVAATTLQTLLKPFGKGFKVTPKGINRDRLVFNWSLALPLVFLFLATAVSLWVNLANCIMHISDYGSNDDITGLNLGWIWSTYNLILLGIGLLIMLDVPRVDLYEWFNLRRVVKIEPDPEARLIQPDLQPNIHQASIDQANGQQHGHTNRQGKTDHQLNQADLDQKPDPIALPANDLELDLGDPATITAEIAPNNAHSSTVEELTMAMPANLNSSTANSNHQTYWGITSMCSEIGAEVEVTGRPPDLQPGETMPVTIEIMEVGLKLRGTITPSERSCELPKLKVRFEQVTLEQHRQLVELLFCRPGQWLRQRSPGEIASIYFLLRSLIKPRALFGKKQEISPVMVCQI
ncbi:glycosyl transferase family 2 [Thalassoporum mexicanum PCC 7367]|uniref:glycosyltransferase family 2 protein n=1 Tax=Thalassoporum mexicanum TaxID=3457544 RepID=UPI00029F90E2|nr:cellulose synthase catalytic subunit [Pseudanabaena sp. PCC 7367]AFY70213.1 glycosyl transferase family 2 [Pseudanabaena sp. PCC 7367]